MIRLSQEATLHQAALLHLAELFVLCHEPGDFLNGDLQDASQFRSFEGHECLDEYVGNLNHEKEYAADEKGFELVSQVVGSSDIQLLTPIIALFNLFYLLGVEIQVLIRIHSSGAFASWKSSLEEIGLKL